MVSEDATCCTRLKKGSDAPRPRRSICAWGPTALLPVFQILGNEYKDLNITSKMLSQDHDSFTKINFTFDSAVASIKVAAGVKSEGELIISGTGGYIYVPAPWWKTDYFEIRYEDVKLNRRYFYQLDGEGIRYEIAAFAKAIEGGIPSSNIPQKVVVSISNAMESFFKPGFVSMIS